MKVLRRTTDNVVHLLAFGLLAVLFGFVRADALGYALGLGFGVLAVRGFRNGVYVGPDTVVVRDTFRTHRVPRSRIDRVDIDSRASLFGAATVLVLDDGTKVPLWALQPGRKRGTKLHEAHVAVLADVQKALAS